ncbi:hypothetical protein AMATHDRAFT_53041 [Amanita thiersii Skay4041]|uniref:Uncharacterized protein n=1 Tax=Amanita thiersii Skay4041 TaxID=703135 RepID=A0A2A9NZR6_9AGAR|nr:hypothetical protein AMATHDRAFT_53041 [Amanita thiersii Skay4041]
MMASQILFFRTRHQQQRMIIDRLKNDVEELKKMNENLRRENSQIRQQFGEQRDQALQSLNSNGKRSWDESHQLDERFQKPRTNASPNAAATSIKPHRHTFTVPHERAPNVVENQDTNYGSALATRRLAEYNWLDSILSFVVITVDCFDPDNTLTKYLQHLFIMRLPCPMNKRHHIFKETDTCKSQVSYIRRTSLRIPTRNVPYRDSSLVNCQPPAQLCMPMFHLFQFNSEMQQGKM